MAFVHALVQDALTSRLASSQRRALHARAVDALDPRVRASPDATLAAAAAHALAAVPAISAERAADLAGRAATRRPTPPTCLRARSRRAMARGRPSRFGLAFASNWGRRSRPPTSARKR